MSADSTTVLTALALELDADLPAVAAHIIRSITGQEDSYAQHGVVLAQDLRETVTANVGGMLAALAGTHVAADGGLSIPHSTGRRRAHQAVPLEVVLHAYRLGGQTLMDRMLALARGRPADLGAFLDVATTVMEVVDRYSEAVVEGYRQAEIELQQRDSRRQQAVMDALLDDRAELPMESEVARLLGLPTGGPYVVAVCLLDLSAAHALGGMRDVCSVYGYAAAWRTRGDREIGIVALGHSTLPGFLEILRTATSGRVGVSGTIETLGAVSQACRFAETALLTCPDAPRDVAWIDDRLLEALVVVKPELAGRLVTRTLHEVLSLPGPERELLLDTLTAWYDAGCSARAAGRRLFCHRNTILNRLRRIETLTGRSFSDHRDQLSFYLAITARRLLPDVRRAAQPA